MEFLGVRFLKITVFESHGRLKPFQASGGAGAAAGKSQKSRGVQAAASAWWPPSCPGFDFPGNSPGPAYHSPVILLPGTYELFRDGCWFDFWLTVLF